MPAGIGLPELIVLFVILVVVFDLKRLPGLGRSIGTGMREFKESISGEGDSGRERRSLREG